MRYVDLSEPFLRADGLRQGIPQHTLDGPAFAAPFRGTRVSAAHTVTVQTRAAAALLLARQAVVSHYTAAQIWGGVVPGHADTHITVLRPTDRPRRPGLSAHVFTRPRESTWLRGLPVTTPAQTFCDLAASLGLVDLVVLGDSFVHQGVVTASQLRAAADSLFPRPRLRATYAADLVRTGAESPMESRARLLMVLAGLPEPQINVSVQLAGRTYRLDMSFPEYRLAIEYDGRQHARSTHQWQHDLTRREDLDRHHWRLIVLRAEDLWDWPRATLDRVVDAMVTAGMPVQPPGQIALTQVHRHFPGRSHRA